MKLVNKQKFLERSPPEDEVGLATILSDCKEIVGTQDCCLHHACKY